LPGEARAMQTPWFTPPSDFWGRLSEASRTAMVNAGHRITYTKHSAVFNAGADANSVYILLDGRIKIYALSSLGKAVILWFCFPGEIFGLAEITRAARRAVTAEACADSTILVIPQQMFVALIESQPGTAMLIMDLLSCRLRGLTDMIVNLTNDDVTTRVIKLLLRLRARYGKPQGGDTCLIDIHLTHQEIADMIGTTRQSANTVINELKRQGLLTMNRQGIHIQNEKLLHTLAAEQQDFALAHNPISGHGDPAQTR
jgi:CRP/FNR family transcriptional regulator, cyclic AMP receptor protein